MSRFDHITRDTVKGLGRQRLEQQYLDRVRLPLVMSDDLLGTLEDLILGGRQRVPADLAPRLAALSAVVPPPLRRELRTGGSIVRLMDQIYEIQHGLLQRVCGKGASPARKEEQVVEARARAQTIVTPSPRLVGGPPAHATPA